MRSSCSHMDNAAARARSLLLVSCLTSVLGLFLAPPRSEAQNESIGTPLSGSLADPIYAENDLTGPSSSLFQGSNNLYSPYLRTGVSDPLDFLIESSFLSPYNLGGSLVGGYEADPYVASQIIADTTVAARFSEYQNNRYLMSGTAATGSLTGRAAAAGALLQGARGSAMTAAAAGSFGSLAVRAPFAAGSSLPAGRPSALSASGTFADPNAMVSALTSPSTLNSMQGGTSGTAYGAVAGSSPDTSSSAELGTTPGVSSGMFASTPVGTLVPAPNSTASGPGPGSVFPDTTVAMSSSGSFQDSTKGTAGLPAEVQEVSTSPLASSRAGSEQAPFPNRSGEETSMLNPTLSVANPYSGEDEGTPSLSEATRKARLHAMIYNPRGTPLPSPFEQRAIQKEFLRKKNKHHISHYPALTAPSVTH